ncbi:MULTISPECIES: hypothetical protein [Winogradskyella]|uniref:hypothetical protein n=1 Tax=Winogradskyella TaxID=286104 RepID=UPI0015CC40DA|nr:MULTISPECIES: hypothetical protein [Winogradskyella]QXP78425.1 hypothetical protein H0I32_14585 [Winogradskyella sp. HaHa_3_26]
MTSEDKLFREFQELTSSFKMNFFKDNNGIQGGAKMDFEIHQIDSDIENSMVFDSKDTCFNVISKTMVDKDKEKFKKLLDEKTNGLNSFRIAFIEK